MPFPLIPATLGICFFLVWAFIGGIVFRDSQLAAQREREFDGHLVHLPRRVRRREAA
jgi:hypothetical protein